MTVRDITIIAILGLLLLGFLTVKYEREPIEELLALRTVEKFEKFGVDTSSVKVEYDGRDAELRGRVNSLDEKDRVLSIVQKEVNGVRVVNNLLQVEAPTIIEMPAALPTASTNFRLARSTAGAITLSGTVHNESERDQLLRTVEAAFPGSAVVDSLTVNLEQEKPTWYTSVLALIPTVGLIEKPLVEIVEGGSSIRLAGEVFGEKQREAIMVDATQAIGEPFQLAADIRIAERVIEEEDPEIAALRQRIETLLRTTRIQFRINTAVLVPLSKEVLDDVLVVLKEAPDIQIEVQGHTDNTGSNAMNRKLSQARADAVRDYLISKGLKAENLSAIGYGPTRPVATNTTLEGRIMNRRVVFSLKGGS